MQEYNPRSRPAILEVVSNQLRLNEPPETKETLNRLMSEGYTRQESMEMIGAVVSAHIYDMLEKKRIFNNEKYVKDLNRLPKMPWED